ncbi:ubiquitin-like domain-containing protein [Streptomyces sp. NPDC057115]
MSNARFGTQPAYGAAYRTVHGDELHLAETVGHGIPGTPGPPGPPTLPDPAPAAVPGTEPAPAPGPGRRSAHRRRPRCADRADSVRRLLPQALVVAFLAGGTAAFVAEDKAVRLDVDGRTRTLHTFADDVTGLLAEEGVRIGPHDAVTPAPGTGLGHGDRVEVRHARPLVLTLDGRRTRVWTTADTVEGALRQLGVRAEGAYLSTSRSRRIGREGLTLDVRTERSVTVMADGRARTIRTNAATVREAVAQAGIGLRGQDTTSVAPDSFPRDGQTVTVLRITDGQEVRDEPIPFDELRFEDRALPRGTEVVERPGRPGVRRVTYALRTVNGVRQKPRRLRDEVVREPRPQQVRVGTAPAPAPAGRLRWERLAACESGGRPDAVDASGTYGGLYQFDTRTWQSLGGRGRPQDAPAEEQTYRAQQLYARSGTSPWPHCGGRLHG